MCPRVVIAACVKLEIKELGAPNDIIIMAIDPLVQKLKLVSQKNKQQNFFSEVKNKYKYKQNWMSQLERMDNNRLQKHALNCKPQGLRDRGRPRKRWQCVDAGTGQTT